MAQKQISHFRSMKNLADLADMCPTMPAGAISIHKVST